MTRSVPATEPSYGAPVAWSWSSGVQVTCAPVNRDWPRPHERRSGADDRRGHRRLRRPQPHAGHAQQTDFTLPVLTAPGGGTVTDAGTVQQVANLLVGQKHRVLLERPAVPDQGTDPTKRPLSSPGTYAVYNASSLLTTQAVVQCAGQEQTWTFTAEGDPATGQINCAVEPARSAALARSMFAQNC